jgi:histone H3-like centromeric protein A
MSVRVRAAARVGRHYAAPNVRRYHFSRKRLAEIRRLQSSTHLLLLKAPFDRVVREIILTKHVANAHRITDEAKEALREAAEHYLHQIILKLDLLTRHRGRVTATIEDLRLALELSKM